MKRCSKCQAMHPRSEFWKATAAPDGLQSYCKPCQRESSRLRAHNAPYDAESTRRRKRLCRYGVTAEQFDAMFHAQAGLCAICEKELQTTGRGTHIDHCHASGTVRGLLCAGCNTALGRIDRHGLSRFAAYLAAPPAIEAVLA